MRHMVLALLLFSGSVYAGVYPVAQRRTVFAGSRFYTPNDSAQHPSVIMLHGSEGGSAFYGDIEANVLAAQGYNVLVYCYFDCNRGLSGVRQTLKDVESVKVLDAVAWLRAQSGSDGRVVVYGVSRGAELTMVIGSLEMTAANKPDGLIAHSPSDVFNGPYNWAWQEQACWLCPSGNCSAPADYRWNPSCGVENDMTKMDFNRAAYLLNGVACASGTRIAIEKYDGPILITVGEKDSVWPVDQTRRLEATLRAAGRPAEVHYFANCEHGCVGPDEIQRRQYVMDFLARTPARR